MSDFIEAAAKILRSLPCRCSDDKELDELRSREAIRALDAAGFIRRPADQDGWLPIESAPKDGTNILVFGSSECSPYSRPHIGTECMHEVFYENGAWCCEWIEAYVPEPSLWHPLPSAPTPKDSKS